MKFLLFFICIYPCISFSQQNLIHTQVIYDLKFQPDSANATNIQKMEMELLISGNSSHFQRLKDRIRDSVDYQLFKNDPAKFSSKPGRVIIRPVNKFSYVIVKKQKQIEVFDSLFGLGYEGKNIIYNYQENPEDQEWILKEDTCFIHDIKCQKAELFYGGRKWIGWFAPDIPIIDGPYKFTNLPGLIVKIYDEKNQWCFEMKSLKKSKMTHHSYIKPWYTVKNKTKKQLYQDRRLYEDNLPLNLKSHNVDNNILQQLSLSIKNDNNWIELYP